MQSKKLNMIILKNLNEALTPEEEKELEELSRENEELEKELGDPDLKGQQKTDIESDIKYNKKRIAELERNNRTDKIKLTGSELDRVRDKLNSLVENNSCLSFESDEIPIDKVNADFSYQRWFCYKQSSPARKILFLITFNIDEKWVCVRLENGKGSLNPLNTDFINMVSDLQKIFSAYTLE